MGSRRLLIYIYVYDIPYANTEWYYLITESYKNYIASI